MSRIITLCICILIITTEVAEADVRITEIAWMGTAESQFGEWFELYNDGNETVNLAGWKLYEDSGAQTIFTMTKSIPASGYLLVERTTTSSPDPVPGISDESGSFGGSGFSNSGENLVLKDNQGAAIQTLNFASGWPAGDADTKETMQWDNSKWVTAIATPKAPFSGGVGGGSPPVGSVVSPVPKNESRIELSIPQTIYTTISSDYSAKTFLEYGEAYRGLFLWNMGDGTTYKSDRPESIKHIYKYPGRYTISFAYYITLYDKKPLLINSIGKTVISPKVIFSVVKGKGFQFINSDNVSVDISGWIIVLPDQKIVELPPLTIIGGGDTVIMPFSSFELDSSYLKATLQTPERTVLASSEYLLPEGSIVEPNYRFSAPLIKGASNFENAAASVLPPNEPIEKKDITKKNYTKIFIFGVVLLAVIVLFVLLEKLKGREEE